MGLLAAKWRPASANNYTKGRQGTKVSGIVIHHAAMTNFSGIGSVFENPNRQASAHYGVGDSAIEQYVSENDTAWHAGDWNFNLKTIGIENVNSAYGEPWPVSEQTIDNLCYLVADIAKRHGLGTLVPGKNIWKHSDISATRCPGALSDRIAEIANRANTINGSAPVQVPAPVPQRPPSPDGSATRIRAHFLGGHWLDEVSRVDDTEDGYAGFYSYPMDGLCVEGTEYRVHTPAHGWLPAVSQYNPYDAEYGMAGVYGYGIDGVAIRGKTYRVHTIKDGWLPWVSRYDINDAENGMAGIYGRLIDGIQVR